MTTGFVYIVRPRSQIEGQEVIKIGMTTRSVRQRVKELSTGSPAGFDVLYAIQVDNARWFEKKLHKRYEHLRVKGGGQEFFRIPANIVIAEIEKIATDISSKKACAARDLELQRYKKLIGAAAAEFRLQLPLIVLFPIVWSYSYYLVVAKLAMVAFPHGEWPGVVIALACIYVLPVGIWKLGKLVYDRLYRILIWSKYGDQITSKDNELKVRFPLAYSR